MSEASSHREPPAEGIEVCIARAEHRVHAASIAAAIGAEVDRGGTGIARRSPEWIEARIDEGTALIAASGDAWAGFCAVRPWEGGKFVSTSALIVRPERRSEGLARRLKEAALALSRRRFPEAVPFGLTTSAAVAAINRDLGFADVPYSALPRDPEFWKGCESCPLHPTLIANRGSTCHCSAMVFMPKGWCGNPGGEEEGPAGNADRGRR